MDRPVSADAAPLGDGLLASAEDRPGSVAELRDAIRLRVSQGLAIYPQGGRTALDYGGLPRRPGVAMHISALDAVIDYPAADMTITVEAGITLARLQSLLATEGQFLPLDAPEADRATVGGILATGTCGPRRLGWGRPRDLILGVTFATADGKAIHGGGRVVKNVAGYDLPKLLTGSMGSLGIITQVTLKVRPRPESSSLVLFPFKSLQYAAEAVAGLNRSTTRPVAAEVLNRSGLDLLGIEGAGSDYALVLGFEDNAPSVAWQVEHIEIESKDRVVFAGDRAAGVWASLAEFPAKRFGKYGATASVRRSLGAEFLGDLPPDRFPFRWHAGSGVIHFHGDPIGDFPVASLRPLATRCGGNLVLSRCPSDEKARIDVWGPRRGDWAIMEGIKAALDPTGVMNPGRFVGTI